MMANAPWTIPSHASLFTGRHPHEHGAEWGTPRLRGDVSTIAEHLTDIGYTAICGTNNALISPATGLARGFARYAYRQDVQSRATRQLSRLRRMAFGGDDGGHLINRWIAEQLRSVSGKLFLFVNYMDCHWSWAPSRRDEYQADGFAEGRRTSLLYRLRVAHRLGPWEAVAPASEESLDRARHFYRAELARADRNLNELLDVLERTGRLRSGSPLILITSDHGEHLGEHGLADHQGSLDDHLTRVPFVAWGPGRVPATVREGVHSHVDVLPSLLRLLGATVANDDSLDRSNTLFKHDAVPGRVAFSSWKPWPEEELRKLARKNPSFNFEPLRRELVSARSEATRVSIDSGREVWTTPEGELLSPAATDERLRDELRRFRFAARDEVHRDGIDPDQTREIERHLEELGYI